MNTAVLESKSDINSSEVKVLIENIENAVTEQNKVLMNEIADKVGESAQKVLESGNQEDFLENIVHIVKSLSDVSSAAFLQASISRPGVNDILGQSDELFALMRDRIKNQKEIIGSEAFNQAINFHL